MFLAGCVTAGPNSEPAAIPISTPKSTPLPSVDVTRMPSNRFGLDCESLISGVEITSLYGVPLPPNLSNNFGDQLTEALIVDGALMCRWGEEPYLDGPVASIEIVAGGGEGASLQNLASATVPPSYVTQTSVDAVGDAAWVNCFGGPEGSSCVWSIAVGDLWLSISFNSVPNAEVDFLQGDYNSFSVTSRDDSASKKMASKVATALAGAVQAPFPESRGGLSSCAEVVDWSAVATRLDLPLHSVQSHEERQSNSSILGYAAVDMLELFAAQRQFVRKCWAEFGEYSADVGPTWVSLTVVPGGEWVESTGLWPAWRAEDCHGWEGGPVCELSSLTESSAVFIRVGGQAREGAVAAVLASFSG